MPVAATKHEPEYFGFPPLKPISRDICWAIFEPPSDIPVDQWADEERYLSPESTNTPSPIRWSTARVPFTRDIMRDLTDPDVHHMCLVKPRQVAGTEIVLNWAGRSVRHAPGPFAIVQPTDEAAKDFSKDRLGPMLRDTPKLALRFPLSRRRDSSNTLKRKAYPGGYVAVLSAQSTASLRSRPVGRIAYDERDETDLSHSKSKQGDPLEILKGATATWADWKIFELSTPLDLETSLIWKSWLASDQRLYDVPCPYCNFEQPLLWRDGEGEADAPEGGDRYRLVCERDSAGELIPSTARYQCVKCDRLIEEKWKHTMLEAGAWHPRIPDRDIRGYRINGLYSFLSWAEIVRRFLEAKLNSTKLKTFVNLTIGLPFKRITKEINKHFLKSRAESYGPEGVDIPVGVAVLVYGVDIQVDRIEVGVWGYTAFNQKWLIRQLQLEGDPGLSVASRRRMEKRGDQEVEKEVPAVWHELGELLDHGWLHASGRRMQVASVAVDAGYLPDYVHSFCRQHHRPSRPVIATIGRAGRGRPILTEPPKAQKFKRGKASRPAAHIIGTDTCKDQLHSELLNVIPGPDFIHFPEHADDVVYDQITAEKLEPVYVHGVPERRWVLPEGRSNEAGACCNYARGAYQKLGPKYHAQLPALEKYYATAPGEESVQPVASGIRRRGVRSRGVE